MRLPALILTCALATAACGDDPSGPAYAPFDGRWRGSLSGITLTLDVVDDDGEVTGTGRLAAVQAINITVDGTHSHPRVSFTGRAVGFEDFEFDGRFIAADTVRGDANGSGFSNDVLLLIRQ